MFPAELDKSDYLDTQSHRACSLKYICMYILPEQK